MPDSDFDRADHDLVAIAIICMIASVELRAIKHVLKERSAKQINLLDSHNGEEYYEILNSKYEKIRIVVACCQGQSNLEAALTTQVILFRHNPRYAFLCGIGGGMNLDKYKLGDVVVASEVIYRRFTKVQNDTDGVTRWFRPEILNVPASTGGASWR